MPERELAELAAHSKLGAYRIVRELGRGGMGVVYEAVHELLQRRVAIKLMRPEFAASPSHVERFVREGRAACNIRHPHVIDVYEFAFADGAPYLVMDYLEGETLADCLERERRLPLGQLLAAVFPVLSAVAAAHAAGVVHRDLKPSNIMLARLPDGRSWPKVLDFGTSKLMAKVELGLTQSAAMIGTPYYMAPEQAQSSKDVDARCDQYALGVILYECATGVRPFEAENQLALLHAIMSAPVVLPSQIEPSLPAAFDTIVSRALQREPSMRFPGVQELAVALLDIAPEPLIGRWSAEFSGAGPVVVPAVSAVPMSSTLVDTPDSQVLERSRGLREHVGGVDGGPARGQDRGSGRGEDRGSGRGVERASSSRGLKSGSPRASQRGRSVVRAAWFAAAIAAIAAGWWLYTGKVQRDAADAHVVEASSGEPLGAGPSGRPVAGAAPVESAASARTASTPAAVRMEASTPAASSETRPSDTNALLGDEAVRAATTSERSAGSSDARSTRADTALRRPSPPDSVRQRRPKSDRPSRVSLGDNGAPILE